MMQDMLPPRPQALDDQQSPAALTVWYDAFCPLCSREIALMRRLDTRRAIAFIDVTTAAACPVDRAELLRRLHAQETGRPIVSGAAAFAAMWRAIPILRPFGLLARNAAVLRLLEWAYLGFLRIRPRLQQLAALFLAPAAGDSR